MDYPVIDLHCDLLSYLRMGPGRTPNDPVCRSSLPQLKAGGVKLQTLAIFSETKQGSTKIAQDQIDHFKKLCADNSQQFIASFENASGFSEETEPLSHSLKRLDEAHRDLKQLLYIGMTWNEENRFGGGNATKIGLKSDGKQLLDWMAGKKIAIDFSHTSDHLAEGILEYIDKEKLDLPVLASHSNFRAITDVARNLPDWLAQEIIRRNGLIGINLFSPFIRKDDPLALVRHVEYALSLGAHNALAFGADFFCDADFPELSKKYQTDNPFFKEYGNAEAYPWVLDLLAQKLGLKQEVLHQIASLNAQRFLTLK